MDCTVSGRVMDTFLCFSGYDVNPLSPNGKLLLWRPVLLKELDERVMGPVLTPPFFWIVLSASLAYFIQRQIHTFV